MEPREVIDTLGKMPGLNAFEVAHVTQFQFYRMTKTGKHQKVLVEILDSGPGATAGLRYHCVAKADDGRTASGNPAPDLDVVLHTVHWGELDRDQ